MGGWVGSGLRLLQRGMLQRSSLKVLTVPVRMRLCGCELGASFLGHRYENIQPKQVLWVLAHRKRSLFTKLMNSDSILNYPCLLSIHILSHKLLLTNSYRSDRLHELISYLGFCMWKTGTFLFTYTWTCMFVCKGALHTVQGKYVLWQKLFMDFKSVPPN